MRTFPEPQYYPSLLEFVILVLGVVELLAVGYLTKRFWERKGETIPPTIALVLIAVLFGSFSLVIFIFALAAPEPIYIEDPVLRAQTAAPDDPRIRLIIWSFFFWLIPMGYYINLLRHSFSSYAVDHIGPLSGTISDPSEFSDARRLALRGDIDGAVSKYRAYDHNQSEALFEAARLLKSEDRFEEAAAMCDEIMRNYPGNRRVWAEACYQLAKLKELSLDDAEEAKRLLYALLQRAPETRFGDLARADLLRLQQAEGWEDDEAEATPQPVAPTVRTDRYYSAHDFAEPKKRQKAEDDENDPAQDPFFAATAARRARDEALGVPSPEAADMAGSENGRAIPKPRAAKPSAARAAAKPVAEKPATKRAAAAKAATDNPVDASPAGTKPAAAKSAPKKPAARKKPSA